MKQDIIGELEVSMSDAVLPVQFFSSPQGCLSPERRLLWAVLIDGITRILRLWHMIDTNKKFGGRARRELEETEAWFLDDAAFFGVGRICDAFGLDGGYIRLHILKQRGGKGVLKKWKKLRYRITVNEV